MYRRPVGVAVICWREGGAPALRSFLLAVALAANAIVFSESAPPPSMGANYFVRQLELDDRPPVEQQIAIAELDVEA